MRRPSDAAVIVPAAALDAPLIAALQNEVLPDEPWREDEIRRFLESRGAIAFYAAGRAYGETMPQGFVLARVTLDEGDILSLGVIPEARRQGLGLRLLDAVMARARELGARRLHLDVGTDNAAGRALYARRGFTEVGRRRSYYRRRDGRQVDGLILAARLESSPALDGGQD